MSAGARATRRGGKAEVEQAEGAATEDHDDGGETAAWKIEMESIMAGAVPVPLTPACLCLPVGPRPRPRH
jgi:hypothetical protein